ncbi:MAG: NADH-quinone oxidoreductase subunit C [Mycobacteriales bacterium]
MRNDDSFGTPTVDVTADAWLTTATSLRDDPATAMNFFDWLSAYDDGDDGLAVVARVWSVERKAGVVLRTRLAREGGSLPTLTGVWAGAAWHERETHEMFGIGFDGHPELAPLLLPEGFTGHPLRKDFILASRVAKEWPGAQEPGESAPGRKRPLGVPRSEEWGAT